jgi:hypothetical protein
MLAKNKLMRYSKTNQKKHHSAEKTLVNSTDQKIRYIKIK